MADVQEGRTAVEHPVEAALAEVEDLLSYCNDILATGGRAPWCSSTISESSSDSLTCIAMLIRDILIATS